MFAAPFQNIESERRLLRVAHLHSSLGVYGAERWTFALLKHLDASEFVSTVITIGTKNGADFFHKAVSAEGFKAFHIAVSGKLNPKAIIQLRRMLVDQKIDILHTHGFKADVLGYLTTRNLPIKLVSTIHGWTPGEGKIIRAYETISRICLKRFDRLYPLSPMLLHQLQQQKFEPSKLQLILNGVDLTPFEFGDRIRKKDAPIELLFAGRICRPKGVFELVRAFAQANFGTSAHLRIA